MLFVQEIISWLSLQMKLNNVTVHIIFKYKNVITQLIYLLYQMILLDIHIVYHEHNNH